MSELTLKLHDDDFAYLELEAEETGLEPAAIVMMLVRKARKASEKPESTASSQIIGVDLDRLRRIAEENEKREAEEQRQREIAEKKARLLAELEALDRGEMTSDEVVERNPPENIGLPEFNEALLRDVAPDPIARAVAVAPRRNTTSVGSMTAPVGLRPDLKGGDVIGDPMGNIVRRNFGHLK